MSVSSQTRAVALQAPTALATTHQNHKHRSHVRKKGAAP